MKKRTLELELRSRTRLDADVGELVASRGLNEAQNACVDVVHTKMHMLRTTLEVPVLKQCDGARVVLSDRCRTGLDEAQLRSELATEVHLLSARSHADELPLSGAKTCRRPSWHRGSRKSDLAEMEL